VKVLLDTHAFLWWLDGDKKLPISIRKIISNPTNEIYISAASAWEVATKYRIGKLPQASAVANNFAQCILDQEFIALPISVSHAVEAGLMKSLHRDPFDRMLIAQSKLEKLHLASNEAEFDAFEVKRVW
jgi:PIN domain nuclease of toxin-antitoxin system